MRTLIGMLWTCGLAVSANFSGVVQNWYNQALDSVEISVVQDTTVTLSGPDGNFALEVSVDEPVSVGFLSNKALESCADCEVFTLRGTKVFTGNEFNSISDLSQKLALLPSGIYLLRSQLQNLSLAFNHDPSAVRVTSLTKNLNVSLLDSVTLRLRKSGFKDLMLTLGNADQNLDTLRMEPLPVLSPWCNTPGNCGTFTDERDGQEYRWSKIGDQTWMAQNLNFQAGGYRTRCYDRRSDNCRIFGLLYTINTADGDAANRIDSVPSGVQGICPDGWHLPSDAEWRILGNFVATATGLTGRNIPSYLQGTRDWWWTELGITLKASWGWRQGEEGTDLFGFAAIPGGELWGGNQYYGPEFRDLGRVATFWTATSHDGTGLNTQGYYWSLFNGSTSFKGDFFPSREYQKSVRCVLD